MADREIVAYNPDTDPDSLVTPQVADRYLAKRAVHLQATLTTDSTIDGRDVAADGTKLDFITVSQPVDLDAIEARINGLDAIVVLKGAWDASAGTFPASTLAGESWICSVPGSVAGVAFGVNDRIVALVDGASPVVYTNEWLRQAYTDVVLSVAGKTGAVVLTEADISDLGTYLAAADIDTLAKLNAIIGDATLGDEADFATAAQGVLAATALQPTSIDTLAKINAILTTPDLIDDDDPRLSNARTPIAHTHDNVTNLLITAYAGGGQTNATLLVEGYNVVSIVATIGDSVKFPFAAAGKVVHVFNRSGNAMDLFPNLSDAIEGGVVDAPVSIASLSKASYFAQDDTIWLSL